MTEPKHWRSKALFEQRQTWRYVAAATIGGLVVAGFFLRQPKWWVVVLSLVVYGYLWYDYQVGNAIKGIEDALREAEDANPARRAHGQEDLDWRIRRSVFQIFRHGF